SRRVVGAEMAEGVSVTSRFGDAPPLLPEPQHGVEARLAASGDMGAMLAALVVKSANQARDSRRELRKTEEDMQRREEQAQIASMHSEADDIRKAGLMKGLGEIGAGVMTVGSGACELGAAASETERGAQRLKGGASISAGIGKGAEGAGTLFAS